MAIFILSFIALIAISFSPDAVNLPIVVVGLLVAVFCLSGLASLSAYALSLIQLLRKNN